MSHSLGHFGLGTPFSQFNPSHRYDILREDEKQNVLGLATRDSKNGHSLAFLSYKVSTYNTELENGKRVEICHMPEAAILGLF